MKKLNKIFKDLVKLLPLVLFFSYYPVISFGANETMNFELSLPLIWLVIFDGVAFILLIKKKLLFKNLKWQWWLFPVWLTLTLFWSQNVVRGILTVGILWLIYFAGFSMWALRKEFDEKFRRSWWKWFYGSTIVVCFWCFLQCILDLVGVPRECSLMCSGCKYEIFGFPHPNGFAAEPQFMGNLLIAPAITMAWMMVGKKAESSVLNSKLLMIGFLIVTSALFLTMSRGAIFAFLISMIAMSVVWLSKKRGLWKRVGMVWLMAVVSFFATLNLQGLMAEVSPTNDTYYSGVSKVVNQLTLGKVDLGGRNAKKEIEEESDDETNQGQANFDGYVEISTEARMSANEAVLKVGFSSWQNALFGAGLGSASIVMYENGVFPTAKEIVNNEYLSLFLETGLIGMGLAVFTLVLILKKLLKSQAKIMILGILMAYSISLCFFSGLANTLQVYLMPIIIGILTFKRQDLYGKS
ncbi:O-antigen ligase family protein [Candidatus Saccharibacteria bacterium]|nr:O-antigen ligase family protein [Candidatus Saccharibacteria bacterium]